MKILITCFGPFQQFNENPSQVVMNKIKELSISLPNIHFEWEELDVKFQDVDKFIGHLDHSHELIVHLGVATGSSKIRIELNARNLKDGEDNGGINFSNLPIDDGLDSISTTIPHQMIFEFVNKNAEMSDVSLDAGSYLCNYIYYKSLINSKKNTKIIFIHLADFQNNHIAVPSDKQAFIVFDFLKYYLDSIQPNNFGIGPKN